MPAETGEMRAVSGAHPVPDPAAAMGAAALAFGQCALPAPLEWLRRAAGHMPWRWPGSLVRRLCLALRPAPYDVTVFGDQCMRLHPCDSRTERRAFAGAAIWDMRERAALADALAAHDASAGPFAFVDAGANVGLYTLWMRHAAARAGRAVRIAAIDCDPENLARLDLNLAASGVGPTEPRAGGPVTVHRVALGARHGEAAFRTGGLSNRGEAQLAPADGADTVRVQVRPLLDVLDEAGIDRADALKIDVEGAEEAVLDAFLASAPPSRWPRLVVIEAKRGADTAALARLREAGYAVVERTRMNAILAAPDRGRSEPDETGRAHGQT